MTPLIGRQIHGRKSMQQLAIPFKPKTMRVILTTIKCVTATNRRCALSVIIRQWCFIGEEPPQTQELWGIEPMMRFMQMLVGTKQALMTRRVVSYSMLAKQFM